MNFNISIWNKCKKCKYLKKCEVAELEDRQKLYDYKCKFNKHIGEINCNKFEGK